MNNTSLFKMIMTIVINSIVGLIRTPIFISAMVLIIVLPMMFFGENVSYNFLHFLPGLRNTDTITEITLLKSFGMVAVIFSYVTLVIQKIFFKNSPLKINYKIIALIFIIGYGGIMSMFSRVTGIPFAMSLVIFGSFLMITLISLAMLMFVEYLDKYILSLLDNNSSGR